MCRYVCVCVDACTFVCVRVCAFMCTYVYVCDAVCVDFVSCEYAHGYAYECVHVST